MSTKSTTQQKATSTQTLDPKYSNLVYGNVANTEAQQATPYQPYTGQMVADFTPAQTQAQSLFTGIANDNVGQTQLDAATAAAQKVAAYKPVTVSGPQATSQGYTAATSTPGHATTSLFTGATASPLTTADPSLINRGDISNLTAGQLSNTDLSPYLNPYINDVVNTTQDVLNRQRLIEQTQNAGAATKAHAFGGTGAATMNAQTNLNSDQTLASTVAQLMSQGFTQAQAMAVADSNRKLTADTSNQAVDLSVAGTNAGNTQAASIFNATSANDAAQQQAAREQAAAAGNAAAQNAGSIFNAGQDTQASEANAGRKDSASQFTASAANATQLANANNTLTAALANQGAIQAGANINLQGANALGALSTQNLTDAITRAGLVDAVGLTQQQQQQAALQWAYTNNYVNAQEYQTRMDQLVNQSLGLVPATGTTSSTGTATTTQPVGIGSILGGLGAITQGIGTAVASDERLKENVETVGYDEKGRRWVDFKYLNDPEGEVHRGVIAQEVEQTDPGAVSENLFGFKMVDYAALKEAA